MAIAFLLEKTASIDETSLSWGVSPLSNFCKACSPGSGGSINVERLGISDCLLHTPCQDAASELLIETTNVVCVEGPASKSSWATVRVSASTFNAATVTERVPTTGGIVNRTRCEDRCGGCGRCLGKREREGAVG